MINFGPDYLAFNWEPKKWNIYNLYLFCPRLETRKQTDEFDEEYYKFGGQFMTSLDFAMTSDRGYCYFCCRLLGFGVGFSRQIGY